MHYLQQLLERKIIYLLNNKTILILNQSIMKTLENELTELYDILFSEIGIDKTTGILPDGNTRFATMPFIGKKYSTAKKKILFIGMDIGEDESKETNKFQSFGDREDAVLSSNNPHIAGTYGTALYLLMEEYDWSNSWSLIDNDMTFQQSRKTFKNIQQDVLSHISLTNFYKFVTIDRVKERSGDKDRKYKNALAEKKLFIEEVKALKPDIIIFQSVNFHGLDLIPEIKNYGIEVYVAPHPSNRQKGGRIPKNYLSKMIKV